jgi:hypothetical protein
MPHVGTLRDFQFTQDVDDIRGAKIYGRNEEKLGEIADVIFDHSTGDIRYVVVDTGGWFTHKQFLIPANRIEIRSEDAPEYRVNLSREEVEHFPKYDPDAVSDSDRWSSFERDYRHQTDQYFVDSGVMHRADSPNIITDPGMPARSTGAPDLGAVDTRIERQSRETTAGAMNTSPTAWGENPRYETLEPTTQTEAFRPDVDSTNTAAELREQSTKPTRKDEESVINADVGAAGRESDRLEEDYVQRSEDTYRDSRMGQSLKGEFIKEPSAPDETRVPVNRANTSDAEIFTAEGDSIFNVADLKEQGTSPGPYASDSGVTPELRDMRAHQDREHLGSHIGKRWERFQDQLRVERNRATAECPECASEWKKAA